MQECNLAAQLGNLLDTGLLSDVSLEIPDVDSDVFREMLQFIYTGKTNKLDQMAAELLAAADKVSCKNINLLYSRKLYVLFT